MKMLGAMLISVMSAFFVYFTALKAGIEFGLAFATFAITYVAAMGEL